MPPGSRSTEPARGRARPPCVATDPSDRSSGARWELRERIACARLVTRLARSSPVRDPAPLVADVLRSLAELLLDARRFDDAERLRDCARELEREDDAAR